MWVIVAAGALTAVAALYLLGLAIVARIGRITEPPLGDPQRLTVVVPAHNEELLVGRCVRSLLAQQYPRAAFDVVVVADNCNDRTPEVAAEAGARVLVRENLQVRGKGAALRHAFDILVNESARPDAIVVVDADSVAEPTLLRGLAARLGAGAEVVQANYQALREGVSMIAELRAAAFLLFHWVRFTGRATLGYLAVSSVTACFSAAGF